MQYASTRITTLIGPVHSFKINHLQLHPCPICRKHGVDVVEWVILTSLDSLKFPIAKRNKASALLRIRKGSARTDWWAVDSEKRSKTPFV